MTVHSHDYTYMYSHAGPELKESWVWGESSELAAGVLGALLIMVSGCQCFHLSIDTFPYQ